MADKRGFALSGGHNGKVNTSERLFISPVRIGPTETLSLESNLEAEKLSSKSAVLDRLWKEIWCQYSNNVMSRQHSWCIYVGAPSGTDIDDHVRELKPYTVVVATPTYCSCAHELGLSLSPYCEGVGGTVDSVRVEICRHPSITGSSPGIGGQA
ncbi:hypothetical protein PoB_003841800 [Plakobranchus ocellatus]|uniref:Uncharacterized protein n=1 Tax=Plakobranchus ocellatus TaxID=259542 RepID=A0AAV4AYJ2_9GAST|nr:hypothetical protein PoB_003841800 [Plakobranchus ocellatus]